MARNRTRTRNKNHRAKQFTLPLAVVAGFSVPLVRTVRETQLHGWKDGAAEFIRDLTGFAPWAGGWNAGSLRNGLLPIIGGLVIHKVASAMGINRVLASAGIPLIRI